MIDYQIGTKVLGVWEIIRLIGEGSYGKVFELKKNSFGVGSKAALYIDEGRAVACNIGDSRIYMMRSGMLQQISKDHTIVQQMVDSGAITKEEARTHKRRHILSQNIGIFPDELIIEPHFAEPIELKEGDVFPLCSDGLTDMVSDDVIRTILANNEDAEGLVAAALENGGRDNVTVIVIKVN